MGEARVISFAGDDTLVASAAEVWLSLVSTAQREGRAHRVALSCGRITRKLFGQVVEQSKAGKVRLSAVEFYWADERCLPPDDPESNFRLANELLFMPLGIGPACIHRIQGELSPEAGAQRASDDLARAAGGESSVIPVLDLVLLGMGEDGHVASLFPGDLAAERDDTSIFLPVSNAPKPPPQRVTLGHGPIAAAREVWVLASGFGKQAALRESLLPGGRTPLAEVIRRRDVTRIYSDIQQL